MKKLTDKQSVKARYRATVFQAAQAEKDARELLKTLKQARAYLANMIAAEADAQAEPEALAYEGLGRERFLAAMQQAHDVAKRAAATANIIEHNRSNAREQALALIEQINRSRFEQTDNT